MPKRKNNNDPFGFGDFGLALFNEQILNSDYLPLFLAQKLVKKALITFLAACNLHLDIQTLNNLRQA
jgi:hypothetical protein